MRGTVHDDEDGPRRRRFTPPLSSSSSSPPSLSFCLFSRSFCSDSVCFCAPSPDGLEHSLIGELELGSSSSSSLRRNLKPCLARRRRRRRFLQGQVRQVRANSNSNFNSLETCMRSRDSSPPLSSSSSSPSLSGTSLASSGRLGRSLNSLGGGDCRRGGTLAAVGGGTPAPPVRRSPAARQAPDAVRGRR